MIIQDPTLGGVAAAHDEVGFFFLIPLIPLAAKLVAKKAIKPALKKQKEKKKAAKKADKAAAKGAPVSGMVIGNIHSGATGSTPSDPAERAARFYAARVAEFLNVEDTIRVASGLHAVTTVHEDPADDDAADHTAALSAQTFNVLVYSVASADGVTMLFSSTPIAAAR